MANRQQMKTLRQIRQIRNMQGDVAAAPTLFGHETAEVTLGGATVSAVLFAVATGDLDRGGVGGRGGPSGRCGLGGPGGPGGPGGLLG